MKRFTVLEQKTLERQRGGYFKEKINKVELIDQTDLQIENKLKELNKHNRTRFYEIKNDYKLKNKKDRKKLLADILNKEIKSYHFDEINKIIGELYYMMDL